MEKLLVLVKQVGDDDLSDLDVKKVNNFISEYQVELTNGDLEEFITLCTEEVQDDEEEEILDLTLKTFFEVF